MNTPSLKTLLLSLLAAGTLSGCVVLDDGPPRRGYGPPAHAPAHGYRRHHHGYDMEYDSGLGVYILLGRPGYYWWDDHYWRIIDGHWHWTVDLRSPWRVVDIDRVPRHLYRHHSDRGLHRGHEERDRHGRERDYRDRDDDRRHDRDRGHEREDSRHYEGERRHDEHGRGKSSGEDDASGQGKSRHKDKESKGKKDKGRDDRR